MTNSSNITELPYSTWLENTIRDISAIPIRGIALMAITENGDSYTHYYECTMADKLLFSGIMNQDATLDMLESQGVIKYDDEENEEDYANGEEES